MAPDLGLPRRLAASVVSSIDAVGELPVIQQKLLEHLASMDRGIWRLEASVRELEQLVAMLSDSIDLRLSETNAEIVRIEQSVATIAERTPDPDAPGAIAKAKEVITGGE